ncbi:MAG: DNA-directed RNA polymerase subunit omega [Emergencia sp.]
MLYPSINEIRKKADSRYTIVIMAAKRSRDIIDGKPILTDCEINKPVSIAAHEIAEDLITYKREENVSAEEEGQE